MEAAYSPLTDVPGPSASLRRRVSSCMRCQLKHVAVLAVLVLLVSPVAAARAQARAEPHSATHSENPDGAIPMPSDRAADSYAIYSLLMPGALITSLAHEPNGKWAIGEITVSVADRDPAIPPEGQL